MTTTGWLKLLSLLLTATVLYAFYMQNSLRTAELSLDLWFAAWKMTRPAPVPALIGGAFAAGLLVAGGWGWVRGLQLQGQIRRLQQEVALGAPRAGDRGAEPRKSAPLNNEMDSWR